MLTARGFSLVELLVGVVLACALGAAVMDFAIRQQRFFAASARAAVVHAAVRQAVDILSADLRPLTPRDGDLYAAAPDHVEFRLLLGASVICTIDAARDGLCFRRSIQRVRSASPRGSHRPSAATPCSCSTAARRDVADDHWVRHVLSADPSGGSACPVASGFTASAAEAAAGWRIQLWPPLAATEQRARRCASCAARDSSLYRAADSKWYLGFYDCLATRATPVRHHAAGKRAVRSGGHTVLLYGFARRAPRSPPRNVASVPRMCTLPRRGPCPEARRVRDSARAAVAMRN